MPKKTSLLLLCLFIVNSLLSQENYPINGVRDNREGAFALTGATIYTDYQTVIENGTLLIRKGKIEQAGTNMAIPEGYTIIPLNGKYIYPSFIDPYTQYGLPTNPKVSSGFNWGAAEQINPTTKGAYNANDAIKSDFKAAALFTSDSKTATDLRQYGFGTVLTFRADGIARGSSALVSLNENSDNISLLNPNVAAHYAFSKGSSAQMFPISEMGFIALLRQTYLDVQWYAAQNPKQFTDLTLDAFIVQQNLPQIFETSGWLQLLRADKLGDEFGIQYIIKGGGDEYQRIAEVKNTKAKLIIPLNFPAAYDVDLEINAQNVSLAEMKHWELASSNAAILEQNGIEFAFTANGLKNTKDYLGNIRLSIQNGLSEKTALKAITFTPALLLNSLDQLGSLTKNKIASFIITSKPIFAENAEILENWVQGQRYILKPVQVTDISGKYKLYTPKDTFNMIIRQSENTITAYLLTKDTVESVFDCRYNEHNINLTFVSEKNNLNRLYGWKTESGFSGSGQDSTGSSYNWSAIKTGNAPDKKKTETDKKTNINTKGAVLYPFASHGFTELPKQETLLIKNGTLWTNETEGIIKNTDILLRNGKIVQIGKNLQAPDARIIDATGKHVTSGIIDEHSHIGATSVNDLATNSGMVRIGDVIDPSDEYIYTSLSGGVTVVQVLHGSANPIGGQSALIKLRWGAAPENMKVANAPGFIKFALGENVKRSSNPSSIRFPQTRMGVEQVYVDAFTAAQDYQKRWKIYNALPPKQKALTQAPRRDLALETMVEILEGKRFITCHSYVQSEINMLMKVADTFGFKVNTFTHILEGYKVADKMKQHGAGASSFSDWWDYKWEVRYAIPYNATILNNVGVIVAINSDDPEMGRRLNQEAAKSVKYGGMSMEDAWKLVTLNPARLLHIDNSMGSLKPGKDADVVIWSDNPLSVYAKVEYTFVDGAEYFSTGKDAALNAYIAQERARLIQKMKDSKKSGATTQFPVGKQKKAMHCDALNVDLNHTNH